MGGTFNVHREKRRASALVSAVGTQPDNYFIRKRRYSGFFGTEFETLLKELQADTLILLGGHTDVCVHFTFVDGH